MLCTESMLGMPVVIYQEQVRKRGLPPLMGEERGQAPLPDLFDFNRSNSFATAGTSQALTNQFHLESISNVAAFFVEKFTV
jgi:hypothetical protein